jgi:secondary thiamine-phosphate synthase enzyme
MTVADTASFTVVHRAVLTVETEQPLQIVDLTPLVDAVIRRAGLADGLVAVTTRHTTTGLMLNEHEPLLGLDVMALLGRLAPEGAGYAHDDFTRRAGVRADERVNGHAHCRAVLLRASETLPVADGQLVLGRWQRVLFVECDGGQRRQVSVTCLGVGRDAPRPVRSAPL